MTTLGRPPLEVLRAKLKGLDYDRLARMDNPRVHSFVAEFVELCSPARVYVSTGTDEDLAYVRRAAIREGEEMPLALPGHTCHFENYYDQGRDREHTLILVSKGEDLGFGLRTGERAPRISEVREILAGIMKGREMFVCFYCLGPAGSEFSIPCVQITDSPYVAHSENILYRQGFGELVRLGREARPFFFVHSEGELDENRTSRNLDKRRIYIDLEGETVYSVNTQYGGNTIGLKKLAMRLAIRRASAEGWLNEHMLIMRVNGPGGRGTYFTGAFPSMCGKTSTAMMEGENILGDDIAYLRKRNGRVRAVNVEKGVFGIIQGINSKDDPIQWRVLNSPGEIIFSNVLVTPNGEAYWDGKDGPVPVRGRNHSGDWWPGKKDEKGRPIPPSHPNARFTVALELFGNVDSRLDDPEGVEVGAIVYGGRDSDTCVPVQESYGWVHGVVAFGASLESETTAATLGKEGVREFNPMSNLDFLSIPVGRYVKDNIDFGKGLDRPPVIFGVNYFLRDREGRFLNEKSDKRVWFKWMELRVHGEAEALDVPTGRIPAYGDLKRLFGEVLGRDYPRDSYVQQFTVRIPENLSKLDRIEKIYMGVPDAPREVFDVLSQQRRRLEEARSRMGDYVTPDRFER